MKQNNYIVIHKEKDYNGFIIEKNKTFSTHFDMKKYINELKFYKKNFGKIIVEVK